MIKSFKASLFKNTFNFDRKKIRFHSNPPTLEMNYFTSFRTLTDRLTFVFPPQNGSTIFLRKRKKKNKFN